MLRPSAESASTASNKVHGCGCLHALPPAVPFDGCELVLSLTVPNITCVPTTKSMSSFFGYFGGLTVPYICCQHLQRRECCWCCGLNSSLENCHAIWSCTCNAKLSTAPRQRGRDQAHDTESACRWACHVGILCPVSPVLPEPG